MPYALRIRDGKIVGQHTGDLRGLTVPDAETLETFTDQAEFHARLEELAPPPPPDAPNFLIAVMGHLGKPRGREILAAYPDIHMALREPYNYTIARQGIDEALADEFLSQPEWDLIDGQWDVHNLPR